SANSRAAWKAALADSGRVQTTDIHSRSGVPAASAGTTAPYGATRVTMPGIAELAMCSASVSMLKSAMKRIGLWLTIVRPVPALQDGARACQQYESARVR